MTLILLQMVVLGVGRNDLNETFNTHFVRKGAQYFDQCVSFKNVVFFVTVKWVQPGITTSLHFQIYHSLEKPCKNSTSPNSHNGDTLAETGIRLQKPKRFTFGASRKQALPKPKSHFPCGNPRHYIASTSTSSAQ